MHSSGLCQQQTCKRYPDIHRGQSSFQYNKNKITHKLIKIFIAYITGIESNPNTANIMGYFVKLIFAF